MFSTRMDWEAPINRLASRLAARRAAGLEVLDLTVSNPTHAELAYPDDAIREAMSRGETRRYEPTAAGLRVAREAIAGYYADRGPMVDPADVVLTSGTGEAYGYLFKMLADAGDDILAPAPSYPLLAHLAALEGLHVRHYPLAYHDGWSIDVQTLLERLSPRTRALVTVHPNNPTGSYVKRRECDVLETIMRDHGVPWIQDEVFLDYPLSDDPARASSRAVADSAGFVLSGLSKVAGLPHLKLSWIVITGPDRFRAAARDRLDSIADTYLSVGTPVQTAAPALLRAGQRVREAIDRRVRRNHARLAQAVESAPSCSVLEAEGGWYATLRVPSVRTGEQHAVDLIARDGVLVQPGYLYDFPGEAYIVVSLLTPDATFDTGVGRIFARVATP